MSRKKILNITSEKKRDNMIPVSYTPSGGSPSPGGYTLTGNTTSFMVWNASYRARNIGLDPNSTANREDDTVFLRGLRESITLQTSGIVSGGVAASWLWRRLVFTAKGLYQALDGAVDQSLTSNGYVRFLANHNGTTYASAISSAIFQGTINVDWVDVMTAKTDSTRFNILYDKVTRLNPQSLVGQQSGGESHVRRFGGASCSFQSRGLRATVGPSYTRGRRYRQKLLFWSSSVFLLIT